MKKIHQSIVSGIVLCNLLLSGCAELPTIDTKQGNAWRFDAYRITKGRGQVFADENNSYAILPNGAKAKRVQIPGGAQSPKWSQQGAVIRIDGCLEKVLVVSERGERLVAEATTPCSPSLSAPDHKSIPNPIDKSTAAQTTPLAGELAFQGSPIEPLKQKGKTP